MLRIIHAAAAIDQREKQQCHVRIIDCWKGVKILKIQYPNPKLKPNSFGSHHLHWAAAARAAP